ncbi:MAG: membrane protein insertion efficiency factor YidD [Clostridia bacterium]|nr:membrane protein insertion efficiency factor YidD [Clostridia bacterium]
MKHLCIALIRFYRKYLSPLKRNPTCRFTPTCSAYALEAYQKRGFFAGTILTVWRILRCNPYCAGGYDPVPEHGFRRVKNDVKTEAYNYTDAALISDGGPGSDGDEDDTSTKEEISADTLRKTERKPK